MGLAYLGFAVTTPIVTDISCVDDCLPMLKGFPVECLTRDVDIFCNGERKAPDKVRQQGSHHEMPALSDG